MVKAGFTPAHPDALEALLHQPLAGTLNHAGADRQPLLLKSAVLHMVLMALEISVHPLQHRFGLIGCVG